MQYQPKVKLLVYTGPTNLWASTPHNQADQALHQSQHGHPCKKLGLPGITTISSSPSVCCKCMHHLTSYWCCILEQGTVKHALLTSSFNLCFSFGHFLRCASISDSNTELNNDKTLGLHLNKSLNSQNCRNMMHESIKLLYTSKAP